MATQAQASDRKQTTKAKKNRSQTGKKGKKDGKGKKAAAKALIVDENHPDYNPESLYKHHMNNKPKPDSARQRDEDIAKWQNEAAVLEKNIREITGSIEKDKLDRSAIKDRRQRAYEEMNAARDVLKSKKEEKDGVFQRIRVYREGRNSLRGDRNSKGKGRNFRTIAELNAAIKRLEDDMSTKVLSLKEEKAKMREMKELNKMRPEVQKNSHQYEKLQQYTDGNKATHDDDQEKYTVLKKAVQKAYEFQQSKYELFQAAITEDTELNNAIEGGIEKRKEAYARQKEIRNDISNRKREYQKNQRDIQRWEQQSRRLKRDADFWTRKQQREEQDRRREEQRAQYAKAREESAPQEDPSQDDAKPAKQRPAKRRAERDDPEPSPKKSAGPRPPRTTRPPRNRDARKPRGDQVHPAPKRDALEAQKFQLKEVITYVKTLLPQTGGGEGTEDQTGKFSRHKGSFKPSRDEDFAAQDLFSNNRKSKKSKRKKKKKKKDVFFVQSHTPPTVQQAFSSLKRWLSGEGCETVITLPMKPSEAEGCINKLTEVEKFIVDWKPSDRSRKPAAKTEEPKDEEATEPAEAPEESNAQPEAAPEKDEPTAEEAAPEDTCIGATEEATEAQEEEVADAQETPAEPSQPEAAEPSDAQPQDGDAEEAAPAVDTKQPDNTVEKNEEDAAPTKATNENAQEGDDSEDESEEEESTDDGEEVVESMVI